MKKSNQTVWCLTAFFCCLKWRWSLISKRSINRHNVFMESFKTQDPLYPPLTSGPDFKAFTVSRWHEVLLSSVLLILSGPIRWRETWLARLYLWEGLAGGLFDSVTCRISCSAGTNSTWFLFLPKVHTSSDDNSLLKPNKLRESKQKYILQIMNNEQYFLHNLLI